MIVLLTAIFRINFRTLFPNRVHRVKLIAFHTFLPMISWQTLVLFRVALSPLVNALVPSLLCYRLPLTSNFPEVVSINHVQSLHERMIDLLPPSNQHACCHIRKIMIRTVSTHCAIKNIGLGGTWEWIRVYIRGKEISLPFWCIQYAIVIRYILFEWNAVLFQIPIIYTCWADCHTHLTGQSVEYRKWFRLFRHVQIFAWTCIYTALWRSIGQLQHAFKGRLSPYKIKPDIYKVAIKTLTSPE